MKLKLKLKRKNTIAPTRLAQLQQVSGAKVKRNVANAKAGKTEWKKSQCQKSPIKRKAKTAWKIECEARQRKVNAFNALRWGVAHRQALDVLP